MDDGLAYIQAAFVDEISQTKLIRGSESVLRCTSTTVAATYMIIVVSTSMS